MSHTALPFAPRSSCGGFAYHTPARLDRDVQHPAALALPRPPITQTVMYWYRNIDLFPIAYAFRPRLRGRLTPRRLPLRRKPWTFGGKVSHLPYRYSCQHDRFCFLQHGSLHTFTGWQNAPLPLRLTAKPVASAATLVPEIIGATSLDQ